MDILMAIRAGIFFTAGLVLLIFPKSIVRMQCKIEPFLVERLHLKFMQYYTKYGEEKCIRTSKNMSIFFFIIALGLLVYSVLN